MRSHSPHVPVRSRVLYDTPSDVPIVFLIGCCVKSSSSGSQRPRTDLFILFFCRLIRRPKRREIAPPHVLPQSHLIPKNPPITDTVRWLVVVCRSIGRWPSTATECIFLFYLSWNKLPSKTTGSCPPPTFHHGQISSKIPSPSLLLLLVGCCIGWSNGSRLRSRPGHSLSFFRRPIHRPKWQGKIPPMRSASLASHHHRPPSPSQPTFGWLLCLLRKLRPPKVAAPPISRFFDGCLLTIFIRTSFL